MADIIIYNTADGKAEIKLYADNGTVWLTQAQMVDLFNSSKSSISEHIKNIFSEDELDENSVVRKIRTTAADGKNYLVSYYSLDVILAVGFLLQFQQVKLIGLRCLECFATCIKFFVNFTGVYLGLFHGDFSVRLKHGDAMI